VAEALRVAIVDDEPLAREGLRVRLLEQGDVEVAAAYGEAAVAARELPALAPEVLFLDIQMPELDGFGVLERIERGPLPVVIFVTAFAEHALRAFRAGAIDYLVKPYDDDTLRAAIERARGYVSAVRGTRPVAAEPYPPRLIVRHERRVAVVEVAELDWVDADGDHVRLHAAGETTVVRSTLAAMAERLDPARFVRVHRTSIVAVDRIRALEPYSRGEHLVVLRDGTKLPLSRRYRARVVAAMGGVPGG
jgi:two-component system LytT family response regulator